MFRSARGSVAMPRRLAVLVALLSALIGVPAAGAASNVTVLSGLNGTVYSSAVDGSGNRFYGGDFTAVDAPRTRQSAVVDATTGAPDTSFPAVGTGSTTSVNASVSDGAGGWFIGGSFTCVNSDATSGCTGAGEVAQVGLAHILANGDIDTTWTAQLAGSSPVAYTMVRIGSTLYVGGKFTDAQGGGVSSTTRTNLAAFDTTTGALQSWNPTANDTVWSMISNGSTLYVGGAFTSIKPVGGSFTDRNRFAALDATTGALLTLDPNINGTVRALALDAAAGIVYVGGDFTAATANGWPYKGIVAVNTAGGVNTTWAPNVINATGGAGVTALAFDATNSKLYVGGNFTGVYSTSYPRSRLAALSTTSACLSASWTLSTTRDTCIDAWSPGTLQMSRDVLLTANTPTSLSSNPVMTLALDGGNLLVGGCFTGIGTTIRRGAARISTTTGAVAAWDPNPSANCVNTIVPGSTSTYLGGSFTTTGGTKRAGVASYDAAGALRAWNPGVDARPTTMELNGSTLYLGGLFNIAGGQQRIQLAGLDLTSGAATGLSIAGLSVSPTGVNSPVDAVRDIAVTAAGSTIYVAGLFDCVGDRYAGSCGGTTRGYAAAFATANGALQAWAPTFSGSVIGTRLALDADNVYFAGNFTGFVANAIPYTRRGVAAFANDPTTTTVRPWDAGLTDGGVWGIAADGTNVYLAGNFTAVQGQPRVQLAAVAAADAATVTPTLRAWAPSIGSTSVQGADPFFLDISADGQYLYGVNQYIRGTNGGAGPRVMTSADGSSWTGRSAARDFGYWRSIAFGGGTFVAVASSGYGNRVMTSTDGATWTSRASAADNTWVSVAYGNGLFVAVAQTGTGNRVMTSPDGITWTSRTSAANNAWTSVTYGNGLFVAVANTGSGNRIMTSPDGITWTSRNAVSDASAWSFVTYAGGLFVAVANTGTTRLMTSPDGITWTAGTIEQRAWTSIAYGNGRFVAVSGESAGGYASTSTNGTAWTTSTPLAVTGTFSSVAYGDGQYIAVGSGQGDVNVLTSADGTTWVPQRSGTPSTWSGVAYGGGRFVAVANANLGDRSGGLAIRLGSCTSTWNAATCVSDWDPGLRSGVAVNAFSLLPDGGAVAAVGSFAPVTIGSPTSTRVALTVDNSSAGALAVTVGGSGASNGLPISCGSTCSASFTPGAVVILVVTTATGLGYQFSGWGGDCSGTSTTCTVTMDAAKSVSVGTATASGATANTLTLATTGTGSGTITTVPTGATCSGSGAGCSTSFASTETLQLVPTATSGAFIGWSGACTGVGTCVVTMSQARSVTAEFGPSQTLSLATTGSGGGSIASSNPSGFTCFSTCSRPLPDGATVTLTPIADSTSLFTGWSGACTGTGACTVPMTQAQLVTATFTTSVTWTLTTSTSGTGTGSISSSPSGISCGATCTASFNDATSVTLTATASSGSTFTGWTGACTGTSTCTISMTQARSVTATFATIPTWTLTTSTSGTGTGSVSSNPSGISCGATCTATFNDATSVTLTATASSGSTFTGWTGACTGTGTCTISMTQAQSVTATFTATPTWTLTAATAGSGSGSISSSPSGISCGATCTATFNDATSVTLTATASSGSTFTGWAGACTGTGTCTISMTQAQSVTATFTIVPADPVTPATTPVEPAVDPAPANTVTFGVASISPSVGTRNSKTTAALITVVTAPGSGTVRQTVSWRVPGRKRVISACRAASITVAAPGSIQLTCALNAKTRRALQRRSLKVTLRTTFTPVGGTPTKLTRTTTIKRAPRTTAEAVQTTVEAKGPGTITQTGTLATPRARAASRVCTSVLRITNAGTYDVGCALTPYGAELLQRQDLRVTLTTTYTPKGGGKPVTISRVVYLPRTVAPGVTG